MTCRLAAADGPGRGRDRSGGDTWFAHGSTYPWRSEGVSPGARGGAGRAGLAYEASSVVGLRMPRSFSLKASVSGLRRPSSLSERSRPVMWPV